MQDVNVVVVFHSRFGSTEQLALAAAVGAVQGRANIRLRLLPDTADETTIAGVPGWKENRERMNREYVAPREADAIWADAIVVGMPVGGDRVSPEFERFFDSLKAEGKIGASFLQASFDDSLYDAMGRAGFTTVPVMPGPDALTTARLQGRRVAEESRARKQVVS